MMIEFPHKAPSGYYYEQTEFKRNVIAIWIVNERPFIYSGSNRTSSIWGFYNTKTKCYHSPINSKTVGDKVDIRDTTVYSAMIPKLTPLQAAFV